jgi:hypothetical protein
VRRFAVVSVVVELRQRSLKDIFKMESKFVIFLLFVFMADMTVVNSQGKKTTVSLSSCDI